MIRRKIIICVLCYLLCFLCYASQVSARPILADLALRTISIDTSFTGMNVLLFGAREAPGDIVVVVKGPVKNYVVRKKEKIAGMWINKKQKRFNNIYGFYSIASSRSLDKIDNQYLLSALGIGTKNLNWKSNKNERFKPGDEFSSALFNNMQQRTLYSGEVDEISFWGGTLFRTNIKFPENIPEGKYLAEVYLISDGELSSAQITPIIVKKTGFEAYMHNLAHENAVIYGILSVVLALLGGWIASIVFQKI